MFLTRGELGAEKLGELKILAKCNPHRDQSILLGNFDFISFLLTSYEVRSRSPGQISCSHFLSPSVCL